MHSACQTSPSGSCTKRTQSPALQPGAARDTLEITNVNGGAVALGHPYGMSGIRYVGSTLLELARRNKHRAVVAVCTAGGMATAAYLERAWPQQYRSHLDQDLGQRAETEPLRARSRYPRAFELRPCHRDGQPLAARQDTSTRNGGDHASSQSAHSSRCSTHDRARRLPPIGADHLGQRSLVWVRYPVIVGHAICARTSCRRRWTKPLTVRARAIRRSVSRV